MTVIPSWLDQVHNLDFSPEKILLGKIEEWALLNGWKVSDGKSLPLDLSQRTDVLLEKKELNRRIRIAVLQKSDNSSGAIRMDSSDLLTLELVYQSDNGKWSVEAGGVRFEHDLLARSFEWLFGLLFQQ